MEKPATQTALDKKMNALSPEKRELLELLFGSETAKVETENEESTEHLSHVEAALKTIWEEILSVGAINKTDNFFALGGDSLHCIQIVGKARKAELNFTTADLFEAQTIENLAQKIGAKNARIDDKTGSENESQFSESGLNDEELARLLQQV